MKKLASLVFIFLITFSAAAQKIDMEFATMDEQLEYKVKYFMNWKTTQDPGYTYIAKKGLTYKTAVMEIKNVTNEDLKIDFSRIAILDKNNNKYQAHHAVQSGKLIMSDKLTRNLGADNTRTFMVEFWPAFPKDEVPRLLIDDQVIELQVKEKKK